jgi:hypothetical protein
VLRKYPGETRDPLRICSLMMSACPCFTRPSKVVREGVDAQPGPSRCRGEVPLQQRADLLRGETDEALEVIEVGLLG